MTRSIHVRGFRSIADTRIPAEGLVLIRGGHGEGKSTLAASIGTALTGRNRWTDKAGKGGERQISHGAPDCVIALDIAERHVTRTIRSGANDTGTSAFRVEGFTGTPAIQAKALLTELGTTRETIDVACDTELILRAGPKERADIIFSALAPSITSEDLAAHFDSAGVTDKSEIESILSEFVAAGVGFAFPLSAAGVEKLHKFVYDARCAAKKDVERREQEIAAIPGAEIDLETIQEARRKLVVLEKVRTDLANRIARAEAHRETQTALATLGAETSSVAELETRLEQVRLETATAESHSRSARATASKLSRALPPEPTLRADRESSWTDVIAIADENEGLCLTVESDTPPVIQLVAGIRTNNKKLRRLAVDNGADSPAQAKEAYETAVNSRAAAVKALDEAEQQASNAETAARALREKLTHLEGQLTSARKRQALMKQLAHTESEDIDHLNSKLAEANSRLSAIRLTLASAAESERHATTRADVEAKLIRLRTRVTALEEMVAALHPSQRTTLLERKAGAICCRLQTAFQTLTAGRYALEIVFDPFEVRVRKSGAACPVAIDFLSASEQYRTAVLLQDAVASLGKSPFLVIDGADILLPEELRDLLAYLETRRNRYQAIIVTAAGDTDLGSNAVRREWQKVILNPQVSKLRKAA